MDNLNLLNDLNDKELDSLMAYAVPYTEDNKINIKNKFTQGYNKLNEEKTVTRKKTKLTVFIIAAVIICLTSITVLAAYPDAFLGLFRNLGDVTRYVRVANKQVTSNGITMELASYLADSSGIVMELVFTREDGSAFAVDIAGVGSRDPHIMRTAPTQLMIYGSPDVSINGYTQWVRAHNNVSYDGRIYSSLAIVYYEIAAADNVMLEVSVNRLAYNADLSHDAAYIDFQTLYLNAEVQEIVLTCVYLSYHQERFRSLFDNAQYTPFKTESGIEIHSVVFAKVIAPDGTRREFSWLYEGIEADDETMAWLEAVDEISGLMPENYYVGIRYTHQNDVNNVAQTFRPLALHLHDSTDSESHRAVLHYSQIPGGTIVFDSFNMSVHDDENGIGYKFFRVRDFDHLYLLEGVMFGIDSYNFIEGDWRIQTQFAANREPSTVEIGKALYSQHPNFVPVIVSADISLFATTINVEMRDRATLDVRVKGNKSENDRIWGADFFMLMPSYEFHDLRQHDFRLRFMNGDEIQLIFSPFALFFNDDEARSTTSHLLFGPFNPEYYTLMNTSQLLAVVIDGVVFPVG